MRYEKQRILFSDHQNALEYAEEKGEARGMRKAAKSMLKDGIAIARVARITGLPKEQIMALK